MDDPMRLKKIIIGCIVFSFSLCFVQGQTVIRETLFTDDFNIDPYNEGILGLSIDNTSFFKNNEFDPDIVKGYTVPGFRISPRITYQPSPIIKLEAGATLLKYWGADKYPNYAYHDISEWKADHYQWGFHLTPFFRAQIRPIPQLNIVLGNIYGGSNHRLIEPLYNRELNLTADLETGAQILYNSRIAFFDAWINWESFIFRNDNHNEAFSIGGSAAFHITNPQSFFYVGVPVQILVIHRGGEIGSIKGQKKTMGNGAAGLRFGFNFDGEIFREINADVMGAGYKSQFSGGAMNLPFYSGWAFYSRLNMQIWDIQLKMSYWRSGKYINQFGSPIFGNVSMVHEGRNFIRTAVINPGLFYEKSFGKGFNLGAEFECFYNPKLDHWAKSNTYLVKSELSWSWSIGVYLRINPSIVLKD